MEICGIRLDSYLLERNRVCFGSYANFHIFYYLVYGSPYDLRKRLGLNESTFCVSFSIIFSQIICNFFIIFVFLVQCLPESFCIPNCAQNFQRLDQIFQKLDYTEEHQNAIYQVLAGILHLGNVTVVEDSAQHAQIKDSSEKDIAFAAKMLNLSSSELKVALLNKTMQDSKSEIM